jgi:23S rRNA pseudouridine1911/1915/1917 synthase
MATLSVEPNPAVTFKVKYQGGDLLIVEKPTHVPTQPGKGHETDTLLNGLFAHYGALLQNLGASRDFGLLHRLDKEASGLLVVALRPRAYDAMRALFETRKVSKFYWAVTAKTPRKDKGVIRLAIVETPAQRDKPKTAHVTGPTLGKAAVTAYRVVESSGIGCLIEARPVTGRLHQVRVHLDAIGCPILGDEFYGPRGIKEAAPRLALHAHRLVFEHPVTGEKVDVKTAWPQDLRRLLARLKLHRPDLESPERKLGPGEKATRSSHSEDLTAEDAESAEEGAKPG